MQVTWQSYARHINTDSRGQSRHGNPIHIFTEVETEAQYHETVIPALDLNNKAG